MSSRTRLVSGAFTARRICGVATILASTLVPAFAQQEPARTPGTQAAGAASSETESERASVGLQEIIITAQFRTESVQDAPLAITAVSDEMLAARSHTNVIDVATRVPNVTLTSAGQGLGNSATAHIRGVGQSDFNFALEPGVGMYIDDVYHGVVFGTIFELVDLDRVEILRGPQGTLAGKNSVGGAIKLFSRKPDATPDGYIEATFGSFDRIDVRGSGDFMIVPDKLFARIGARASARRLSHAPRLRMCHRRSIAPIGATGRRLRNRYGGWPARLGCPGGLALAAIRPFREQPHSRCHGR